MMDQRLVIVARERFLAPTYTPRKELARRLQCSTTTIIQLERKLARENSGLREILDAQPHGETAEAKRRRERDATLLVERILPPRPITTQRDIAKAFGISVTRVHQIERRLRYKLRQAGGTLLPEAMDFPEFDEAVEILKARGEASYGID